MRRGSVKALLKDYSGAVGDYDRAVQLNTNSVDAYRERGRTQIRRFNYQLALADFNRVIVLSPTYGLGYGERAHMQIALGTLPAPSPT